MMMQNGGSGKNRLMLMIYSWSLKYFAWVPQEMLEKTKRRCHMLTFWHRKKKQNELNGDKKIFLLSSLQKVAKIFSKQWDYIRCDQCGCFEWWKILIIRVKKKWRTTVLSSTNPDVQHYSWDSCTGSTGQLPVWMCGTDLYKAYVLTEHTEWWQEQL